jgi:hypothetical protein
VAAFGGSDILTRLSGALLPQNAPEPKK